MGIHYSEETSSITVVFINSLCVGRVIGTGPVDPLVQRIAMVKRKNDNAEVNRMEF